VSADCIRRSVAPEVTQQLDQARAIETALIHKNLIILEWEEQTPLRAVMPAILPFRFLMRGAVIIISRLIRAGKGVTAGKGLIALHGGIFGFEI
jgi:hypothetical protein